MADDKEEKAQPIIIKRVKKAAHAHHGGAWKVAYADFVTAMMAFFLLLWLLQATTEEQKLGIADYFAPASVLRNTSGSGGLMSGRTFAKRGSNPSDQSPVGVMIQLPTNPPDWDNDGDPEESTATEETGAGGQDEGAPEETEQAEAERIEEMLAKREEEQFAQAEQALFFPGRQIANGKEGCRVDLAACEVEYSNSTGMLLQDKQSFEIVKSEP